MLHILKATHNTVLMFANVFIMGINAHNIYKHPYTFKFNGKVD